MRADLVKQCKDLHMKPIENIVGIGTPDVTYIDGWLELKILDDWPAKPGTVVKFKRYTKDQKLWLRTHWELGGRAFLVAKVAQEWLVIAGPDAVVAGSVTRSELESVAILHMKKFDPQIFKAFITESMFWYNVVRENTGICERTLNLMKSYSFGAAGLDIAKPKHQNTGMIDSPTTSRTTGTKTGSGKGKNYRHLSPSQWED